MAVRHFLKDGREVKDIKGHVVRMDDAKSIYTIIDRINERKERRKDEHHL